MAVEVRPDTTHSKAVPALIEKLLAERQEMLVLFNRLAELRPFTDATPAQPLLQRFCQVMVDYAALGHFEVFQCVEENADDSERCRHLVQELYDRIDDTTQSALDFNDCYDCEDHCWDLDTLGEDLSRLGEQLAIRIETEDRLIAAIRECFAACPRQGE